ncbi:putative transcriptional regulator, Crp/Fnr family [Methylobacterium sp. 4-46]|uniref:Crp/Fnr family transcriptional regulator n=1 Tax=unclassified Methylobacterium TaxID=2615210 RepID=UPI000152E31B|nr:MULTISPECIES: helix-turn-helix domain-containing protein [Methylobacterium]ACA19319.1 putative transcriptional regulator, Crp/Fnr family [Methylobacterium sp. 4-46]WFT78521.1 helix-turn-helix domain-containing protein [Methylobacterium nodulans]
MSALATTESAWSKSIPLHHTDIPRTSALIQPHSRGSLIPRGRALFWEGDTQAHKIEIVEGVVRAVRLFDNGNRQILAFFWSGDVVMPSQADCQHFTAEAVTNCRVRLSAVSNICQSGERCGVHQVLAETLSLVSQISQKSGMARITSFLLTIRKHLPRDPKLPSAQRLLISRADIADHVGTSLETVCRTLAELKARNLIDMPNRKTIRFLDLPGLHHIAGD